MDSVTNDGPMTVKGAEVNTSRPGDLIASHASKRRLPDDEMRLPCLAAGGCCGLSTRVDSGQDRRQDSGPETLAPLASMPPCGSMCRCDGPAAWLHSRVRSSRKDSLADSARACVSANTQGKDTRVEKRNSHVKPPLRPSVRPFASPSALPARLVYSRVRRRRRRPGRPRLRAALPRHAVGLLYTVHPARVRRTRRPGSPWPTRALAACARPRA